MNATFSMRTAMVLVLSLIGLGAAAPAAGQLTLDAFSPAHGSTQVGLEIALTLTFSAPLDTTGGVDPNDDFLLGIEITPEVKAINTVSVSADRLTVTAELTLEADAQYWVYLARAQSTAGETLDRPYVFTFTTGTSLPNASVSGTAAFAGSTPYGAVIGLAPETFFEDLLDDENDGSSSENNEEEHDEPSFTAISVVADSTGAYTVDFVPPGRYVMIALRDIDLDGDPTGRDGEGFGAYDADANRTPDVLVVEERPVDGIDLSLQALTPFTARANFDDVERLATANLATDATLTGTFGGELTPAGEAGIWSYFFHSESTRITLGVVAFYHLLAPTSPLALGDSTDTCDAILCDLTLPLPEDWIDSDAALDIMEELGGADYRARLPDATINAALLHTAFSLAGRHDLPAALRLPLQHIANAKSMERPVWLISYQTPSAFSVLIGLLDAQTGEVLEVIGKPSAATEYADDATDSAVAWQDDARLVSVTSLQPLDPDGNTVVWNYIYYSPTTGTARSVALSSGTILSEEEGDASTLPSLDPLPENWIDSSVAAAEAEARSNDFRGRHPDAQVFAQLSRGFRSSTPDRPVWRITYLSQQDAAVLELDIDASSGQVIVSTEADTEAPARFTLHQNYPNPFNPETTISYELSRAGLVELFIYDLLGRRVRTLANTQHTPGTYRAVWDGTNDAGQPVPSGLYFYEIRLGETVQAKMLTLIR